MKFYIHCEDPELTVVVNWEDAKQGTLETVLDIFTEQITIKYPSCKNTFKRAVLYSSKGVVMDLTKDIAKQIKHMADIYVKFNRVFETNGKILDLDSKKIDTDKLESSNKETANVMQLRETSKAGIIHVSDETKKIIEEKNNLAIVSVGNEKYRNAMSLYNEILKLDPANKKSRMGLITCYLRAARFKEGLKVVNEGLKEDDCDLELLLMKGRLLLACGDGDSAVETLLLYSRVARQKGGINREEKHDVQVLLAKGYLLKQQNDMALNILQGVLREDQERVDALAEYASILFRFGPAHAEEAMNALMKLLAKKPGDKTIKHKFADACSSADGMKILKSVAEKAMQDVAALVFLATNLRDCGAISEATELMEQALKVDPGNAHTLLTYVHMLELVDRHRDGIDKIQHFVHMFPAKHVSNLTCSVIYQCLLESNNEIGVAYTENACSVPDSTEIAAKVEYSDEERYLLAVFFTLIKLLFIKAELHVIPRLLKCLEPCCKEQDLHLTNIRNEAAYFSCIAEIFRSWDPSYASKKLHEKMNLSERKYVYFLGDSHCIPPAWNDILIKGESRLICPVLSTGTKIWHLRPESKFYPKTNFYSNIRVIPHGADVITCFGEIDCREALLVCWEKARYNTIEDAMETVVRIYLAVLENLQKKHHWNIYVNPVLPVLDLTRPIVMQFNKILSAELQNKPGLHWLKFAGKLLTEDGLALKDEFKLDGTHVHPSYTKLIEEAIQATHKHS